MFVYTSASGKTVVPPRALQLHESNSTRMSDDTVILDDDFDFEEEERADLEASAIQHNPNAGRPYKYISHCASGIQGTCYHCKQTSLHLVVNTSIQNRRDETNIRDRRNQRDENELPFIIDEEFRTISLQWTIIKEMDFPSLAELSLPDVKDGENILCCGSLEYYDKTYDTVNVKSEKPLRRSDRIFHTITTTEDPIICSLADLEGNVYATDAILATIMCCTRSIDSWDIVITKIGDKLYFDKGPNTEIDLLTVNETSVEPPQDGGSYLNAPRNLAIEATIINHNFSQQVLKSNESKYKFEMGNPFISEEEQEQGDAVSVAYLYRKWDLKNGIVLVARCEHDAVMQGPNNETQFLTIKAFNEWNSKLANGLDWRQKLDTERDAVLKNELRNNACKVAKWTVQALLAGSDQLKFGYVSRATVTDTNTHVILGTQQYKPNEFATEIKLNMDNAWGILRAIIDLCRMREDGKYLIVKDSNKPMIQLYNIPDGPIESEGEEEEDEEEDENEEEDEDEEEDDDEPVNDAFQVIA